MIIGLCGDIASGKTTFANYLAQHAKSATQWESWKLVAEVATALRQTGQHPDPDDIIAVNAWLAPLPAIVQDVTNRQLSFDEIKLTAERLQKSPENYAKLFEYLKHMQARPELTALPLNEETKEDLRSILQWLGGYLVKIADGVWYDEIIRRIQASPRDSLAVIAGVRFVGDAERIKHANGLVIAMVRPHSNAKDKLDITEREHTLIPADATIFNNADKAHLKRCAAQVLHDAQADKLASEYSAAMF